MQILEEHQEKRQPKTLRLVEETEAHVLVGLLLLLLLGSLGLSLSGTTSSSSAASSRSTTIETGETSIQPIRVK